MQRDNNLIEDKLFKYPPESPLQERSSISTSEKGRTYRCELKPSKLCSVYKVDEVIIQQGSKCDKLVLVKTDNQANNWTEVFVELKGRDVKHAVEQLETTIDNTLFYHPTISRRLARIVAQQIPRNNGNSVVERARDRFYRKYKVELKAWSSGNKDIL